MRYLAVFLGQLTGVILGLVFVAGLFFLLAGCSDDVTVAGPAEPSELRLTTCAAMADEKWSVFWVEQGMPCVVDDGAVVVLDLLNCSEGDQNDLYLGLAAGRWQIGWQEPLDLVHYQRCVER